MTGRVLIAALVCALSATAAFAQAPGELGYTDVPEMPEGIEGERVQMLLDAVNNGDVELAKRFHEESFSDELKERFPLAEFVGLYEGFVRQVGSIDFHSVRVYDPPREDVTVIIFWDMNFGAWKAFSFQYGEGDKPDGLLNGFTINRARTPSDVEPEGPLTEEEAIAEVWPFLDRLCERDLFSGTVMIAKGDEVLLAASCGEASKRFRAAVTLDTKFNIGSMNKMFTSTAIMQLVEKGLLSVDDPISGYVDESWLPPEMTERITVHHLLTHTSGLGSYFTDEWDAASRKLYREVGDYKPLFAGDTLAFAPGTDWSYSNTGMFMAGVVIESVTGEDYFDYIRENIYAPAGMENTDCYDMDCPVENLAIGYWPSDDCASGWKNNYYEHVIRGGPAGGGFSTAPDLFHFARALEKGVLVSGESLEVMWTDHFDPERPYGYGYGFGLREGRAGKVVGHGGGFTGI
ncbi:MAG: beta-lactamase family protein, partial [Candidatus Eisenbacteria sp.]|nr:beta-lactamase family protein [Candidatus Eisenbacteria bacterium]